MSEIIEKLDKSSESEDKSDLAKDFSEGVEKVKKRPKVKMILLVVFLPTIFIVRLWNYNHTPA